MFDWTCIEADSSDSQGIRFGHGDDCALPADVREIVVFDGTRVVATIRPAEGKTVALSGFRLGQVPAGFTIVGDWPASGTPIEVMVVTPRDQAGILLTMP